MLQDYQKYFFLALIACVFYIFYLIKKRGGVNILNKLKPNSTVTPFLDMYTIDFTKLVQENKLDPIIGRAEEVKKLSRVLSRRRKNNALLVGDPGVGKTAIVEGLAQRIIQGDVPDNLINKRVLALEVSSLMAGTKYRGEFEQRARKIVKEIANAGRSIILFIDEVHAVVQSHGTEGAINFADILKPALARGELQMIGATTFEEYEKYIKTDLSLERRFQSVSIGEPSIEETMEILNGVKDKYGNYHKVEFTDAALETAVKQSRKLVKDRRLPDKAIDALDEAGAMINITHMHESINTVLYQAVASKNPKAAKIWKQIQEVDSKLLVHASKQKESELTKKREKLEKDLSKYGVMVIDSDDIEKVIEEWAS